MDESACPGARSGGPPSLDTERLRLRALEETDAGVICRLAGDRRIAAATLTIPHPYDESQARTFIAACAQGFAEGRGVAFGIVRRADRAFVGVIGLKLESEHARAELGYWIGVPAWGFGYATEAGRAVLGYGFGAQGCHRIYASVYRGNDASRHVLEKLGMRFEGCQRGHIVRLGVRQDVECFGLLHHEWQPDSAL